MMRVLPVILIPVILAGCRLPEIRLVGERSERVTEDPNNRPPLLRSCVGVSPSGDPAAGHTRGGISGVQPAGKLGFAQVFVTFTVTATGSVDPLSVDSREAGSEHMARGMGAVTPTHAMITEAKQIAKSCLYDPALKDGKPVAYDVRTSFVLTRDI